MKKNILLFSLLCVAQSYAMEAVKVEKNKNSRSMHAKYTAVTEEAEYIVASAQTDSEKIYSNLRNLDSILESLLEDPHDLDAVAVAELNVKELTIRSLQHGVRKCWVKALIESSTIDESKINVCLDYLISLAQRLNENIAHEPTLTLKSCIEVFNDFVALLKKFSKELCKMKSMKSEWERYLKWRGYVDPSCLQRLRASQKTIDGLMDQFEEQLVPDKDARVFHIAYSISFFVNTNLISYFKERRSYGESDSEASDNLIPDAEKYIESMMITIERLASSTNVMINKLVYRVITTRDELRRNWAKQLIKGKDKEAMGKCIASLRLLIKEYNTREQLFYNDISYYQRKIERLNNEIIEAKEYISQARERLNLAVMHRNTIIERIEKRPMIADLEENAQPYRPVNRIKEVDKEIVTSSQRRIDGLISQALRAIKEIEQEKKNILKVQLKADEEICAVQSDKLTNYYGHIYKLAGTYLREDMGRVFRDKEGVKDDYTDEEFVALGNLQEDAFGAERIAGRVLDEEKRRLYQREKRMIGLQEDLERAMRVREKGRTDHGEFKELINLLERKMK